MIPILEKDINECEGSDNCYHISPIPLATESTIVNKNTVLRALVWGVDDWGRSRSTLNSDIIPLS